VKHAVVIGASGGIGSALVDRLSAQDDCIVHALSRAGAPDARQNVLPGILNLDEEDSIRNCAAQVARHGKPDLVIVASGMLHDQKLGISPEKSLKAQTREAYEHLFQINTIGPAIVAKHFIPIMPRRERAIIAFLSARVGSISDNRLGGWHAYRASKAALNMLIRNYAIEQARVSDEFICVGLHPGTVDTALSLPFQANVPSDRLFRSDLSAGHLLDTVSALSPAQSGQVFDWQGNQVAF